MHYDRLSQAHAVTAQHIGLGLIICCGQTGHSNSKQLAELLVIRCYVTFYVVPLIFNFLSIFFFWAYIVLPVLVLLLFEELIESEQLSTTVIMLDIWQSNALMLLRLLHNKISYFSQTIIISRTPVAIG